MRRAVSFLLHAVVAMVISPIAGLVVLLGTVILFDNSHGNKRGPKRGRRGKPVVVGPGIDTGPACKSVRAKEHCLLGLAGRDGLDYVWDIRSALLLSCALRGNLLSPR